MSNATDHIPPGQTAERQAAKGSLIVRRDAEISEELRNSDLHPLLKKIYANRGVTRLKQVFLDYLKHFEMPGTINDYFISC